MRNFALAETYYYSVLWVSAFKDALRNHDARCCEKFTWINSLGLEKMNSIWPDKLYDLANSLLTFS